MDLYIYKFADYLYDYFTFNGKCAHYIQKSSLKLDNYENHKTLTMVFNYDEIEYKYNKNKIQNVINQYFNQKYNVKFQITEKVGIKHDKVNFMFFIQKNKQEEKQINLFQPINFENIITSDCNSDNESKNSINDNFEIIDNELDKKYFI